MNCFLILCLMALATTSGWILNEKMSPVPTRPKTPKPRRLVLQSNSPRRNIQRLIYLKHMLELNCLRHMCKTSSCKAGSGCQPLPESASPVTTNNRNQHRRNYYDRRADNLPRVLLPYRRRPPMDDRFIFPPNVYFINSQVENPSQNGHSGKKVQAANLINQKTENLVFIHVSPHNGDAAEGKLSGSNVPKNEDKIPKSGIPSNSYWQHAGTANARQYEVEEDVDESPKHDSFGKGVTNTTLGGILTNNINVTTPQKGVNNSVNVTSFHEEPMRTLGAILTNNINITTPQKGVNNSVNVTNFHEEGTKQVKITQPDRNSYSRGKKIPVDGKSDEETQRGDKEETLKTSKEQEQEEEGEEEYDYVYPTTYNPFLEGLPSEILESVDSAAALNIIPPAVDDTTAEQKISPRIQTTETEEPENTDWRLQDDFKSSTTVGLRFSDDYSTSTMYKSVEYFSETAVGGPSTPNFEEFTDHPLVFDLFPPKQKEPEVSSKNSRKMHFGDMTANIKEDQDEQRRSDILITDVDYYDYDSNAPSSNYLERLKENSSVLSVYPTRNLSADALIPLISVVIGDLREGRVAEEDMPILSELFGKYWPTVLKLSNNTNIDMLPLLKMKDEKDLENVLRSFIPDEQTTAMPTESDYNKNLYYDLYEYDIDNLYKDIGGVQESAPIDKRKRYGGQPDLVH